MPFTSSFIVAPCSYACTASSARRCLFSCGDVMCLTPSLDVPAASSRRWTDAGSSPTQFHVPRSGVGDVSACHITVELCVYRGVIFYRENGILTVAVKTPSRSWDRFTQRLRLVCDPSPGTGLAQRQSQGLPRV
jgi:hypothetical protein